MANNRIIIEKAQSSDVDELYLLMRECFEKHKDIDEYSNPYYITKERILFNIKYPYGSFLKIVLDSKIIGGMFYYFIDETVDKIHIDHIFIKPNYQHQGYGKQLFNYLFKNNKDVKEYHLDYVKTDKDVELFYQNLGFKKELVEIDHNYEFVTAYKIVSNGL